MSAFSRGLGTRLPFTTNATFCARQPFQPFLFNRFLNSLTPLRSAAQPLAKTPLISKVPSRKAVPKPPQGQLAPKVAPTTYAYVQALAQKHKPTLLYESASHAALKASAWGAAIFCYAYAGFNYWTVVAHPPPDISWWVPHAFGLICIAMGGMGTWVLLGSTSIIKSIRVVPVAKLTTAPAAAARTTPIHLEVTVKPLFPFMKPKVVTAAPEEFSLHSRLYRPVAYQTFGQREAAQRREKERQDAQWAYDRERLLSVPFRHAGRGLKSAWRGVGRALTKEGFVKMTLGKTKYKLDVESGWSLEEGRALERLVKINDGSST